MTLDASDSYELLTAVIALAAADGNVTNSELAVIKALARKAAVEGPELDAMIESAAIDAAARQELLNRAVKQPERAMSLLIAAANIDGNVSEEERNLLVDISCTLGVPARRFGEIFQSSMAVSSRITRNFNPVDREKGPA
jgi:tellurite resistance protein